MPCSSARSCSSASARSSGVGGSAARSQQERRGDRRTGRCAAHATAAAGPRRAGERNRRARKIQRVAVAIDDDLHDVRILPVGGIVDAPPQRAHLQRRVARTARPPASIISGSSSGSSPCTLTINSQSSVARDFRQPVGAAAMGARWSSRRRRRTRSTARAIRSSSVATMTASTDRGRGGAAVARARSSAGRRCPRGLCPGERVDSIARGDDGDDAAEVRTCSRPGGRNRGHVES